MTLDGSAPAGEQTERPRQDEIYPARSMTAEL
jgi:hypothetical protein